MDEPRYVAGADPLIDMTTTLVSAKRLVYQGQPLPFPAELDSAIVACRAITNPESRQLVQNALRSLRKVATAKYFPNRS